MYHVTKVSIKDITVGDTVIHQGHMRTVGKNDIKRDPLFGVLLFGDIKKDPLFGVLLFGDSYNLARILIEKVTFPKWYQGKQVDLCSNS